MSRDLEENSYYVSQGGLIPIKWTAPEVRTSLFQGCTEQWNSHNAISLSSSVTITVKKIVHYFNICILNSHQESILHGYQHLK